MLTPDNYLEAIGGQIRLARQSLGWHQIDLAAATDLQRTYIVEVESGKRKLSLLNLVRIAEALELPLSALIARAEAVASEPS